MFIKLVVISRKMSQEITRHFDEVAQRYDFYKRKNWYYYEALKRLYAQLIPHAHETSILEVGCGTGDILASLHPRHGVGIDVSKEMVRMARAKHKDLDVEVGAAESWKAKEQFDYIILSDVIEHLSDVNQTLKNLASLSTQHTIIIITMANPLWEPLLMLAEKAGMKMPEGPHTRLARKDIEALARQNGLKIVKRGKRLLIPKKIPLLHAINDWFYKIPLIRKLGLIEYLVVKKET